MFNNPQFGAVVYTILLFVIFFVSLSKSLLSCKKHQWSGALCKLFPPDHPVKVAEASTCLAVVKKPKGFRVS